MSDYRRRVYEKYATTFKNEGEQFNTAFATYLKRLYDRYFHGWLPADKDASIVDLACGQGNVLYQLRENGYRNIRGVDISGDQLRLARQVTDNVIEADVLEYVGGFEDEFDLIIAVDLIEHFRKDEVLTFLDGCFKALRRGGRLIIHTPNGESPFGGQIYHSDFTHETCFTTQSLERVMRMCGFERTESRERGPVPVNLSGMARCALWQCMRGGIYLWNKVELGTWGSGVFTRIFMTSGVKGA